MNRRGGCIRPFPSKKNATAIAEVHRVKCGMPTGSKSLVHISIFIVYAFSFRSFVYCPDSPFLSISAADMDLDIGGYFAQ